eukprot:jgi/Mesvir1/14681/Mv05346-RA.1
MAASSLCAGRSALLAVQAPSAVAPKECVRSAFAGERLATGISSGPVRLPATQSRRVTKMAFSSFEYASKKRAAREKDFSLKIPDIPHEGVGIRLFTERDCVVGISLYPDFAYNAEGGGGWGVANKEDSQGRIPIEFNPTTLIVPPINVRTFSFMGIQFPYFLTPPRVEIKPSRLTGFIEKQTGQVELELEASFQLVIGSVYRSGPMQLTTTFTTETSQGHLRGGRGKRLDAEGRCTVVGIARVPSSSDILMNTGLLLPNDVLVVLQLSFEFWDKEMEAAVGRPPVTVTVP